MIFLLFDNYDILKYKSNKIHNNDNITLSVVAWKLVTVQNPQAEHDHVDWTWHLCQPNC